MKYRALTPFLAFGKAPQPGELVDLTAEQAAQLGGQVAPYEVKVQPKPENKSAPKKSSGSARLDPVSKKKTAKSSKRTAKK